MKEKNADLFLLYSAINLRDRILFYYVKSRNYDWLTFPNTIFQRFFKLKN